MKPFMDGPRASNHTIARSISRADMFVVGPGVENASTLPSCGSSGSRLTAAAAASTCSGLILILPVLFRAGCWRPLESFRASLIRWRNEKPSQAEDPREPAEEDHAGIPREPADG
jgi:hypothetical protein